MASRRSDFEPGSGRIPGPGTGTRMVPMPDLEHSRSPSGTGDDTPAGVFQPPAWNWSKADDTGWWVRADWDRALLEGGRLKLDEWRRSGVLTTVKRGPHRVVYRADLAEGPVYVKHFLV